MSCDHVSLTRESSQHSAIVGYPKRTLQQLKNAAGKPGQDESDFSADYASPLIFPDDDLSNDPRYPAQSLRAWQTEKERNKVVVERRTIYVTASPDITPQMARMVEWSTPNVPFATKLESEIAPPNIDEVTNYLTAFYHGLPVKILPKSEQPLRFVHWEDSKRPRKKPNQNPQVALATASEAIRIRARPCPDNVFPFQLNLNDILDVVIEVLPQDAYCLLLLVDQDLYEDEDDDYCCGRAYGGSRCAVVSTARYNPFLYRALLYPDDLHHPWPLSHCVAYMTKVAGSAENVRPLEDQGKASRTKSSRTTKALMNNTKALDRPLDESGRSSSQALERAFAAFKSGTPGSGGSDWLFGVCRTASHEIGHCFGMDHCVYFACIMQGTASMAEDRRQPPDLCPIDRAKLEQAVNEQIQNVEWEEERYEALAKVCREQIGGSWSAFQAWLEARLERLKLT